MLLDSSTQKKNNKNSTWSCLGTVHDKICWLISFHWSFQRRSIHFHSCWITSFLHVHLHHMMQIYNKYMIYGKNLQSWIVSLIKGTNGLRKQRTCERRVGALWTRTKAATHWLTDFLPHHVITVARTRKRIVRYSSDEGLWYRPKCQGKIKFGCDWYNVITKQMTVQDYGRVLIRHIFNTYLLQCVTYRHHLVNTTEWSMLEETMWLSLPLL